MILLAFSLLIFIFFGSLILLEADCGWNITGTDWRNE